MWKVSLIYCVFLLMVTGCWSDCLAGRYFTHIHFYLSWQVTSFAEVFTKNTAYVCSIRGKKTQQNNKVWIITGNGSLTGSKGVEGTESAASRRFFWGDRIVGAVEKQSQRTWLENCNCFSSSVCPVGWQSWNLLSQSEREVWVFTECDLECIMNLSSAS